MFHNILTDFENCDFDKPYDLKLFDFKKVKSFIS